MKTVFEHIEYMKGKPHHIRKRIAFGAATGVTALIALVWLTGSLRSGAFAIAGSSFDERASATAAGSTATNSGLAGAAAALPNVEENAPARIEIIDVASSTSGQKKTEQTTIPF